MAVTESSFRALFPEFAATDAVRVQRCIDVAALCVHAATFGDSSDLAISYLAAHLLNQDPQSLDTPAYPSGYDANGNVSQSNVFKGNLAVQGTSTYLNTYNRIKAARVPPGGMVL